jgi:hypothetical protein
MGVTLAHIRRQMACEYLTLLFIRSRAPERDMPAADAIDLAPPVPRPRQLCPGKGSIQITARYPSAAGVRRRGQLSRRVPGSLGGRTL